MLVVERGKDSVCRYGSKSPGEAARTGIGLGRG